MCVGGAFRKYTLLPLDDCLYALQPTSRCALRRLYQRHGISRLPNMHGDKPQKSIFNKALVYVCVDTRR